MQFTASNGGGAGTLTITAVTENAAWLTVTPAVGAGINISTTPATFTATVDRNVMSGDGVYTATITVTAGLASVPVQVTAQKITGPTGGAGNAGFHYVLLLDHNTYNTIAEQRLSASNGQYAYNFPNVAPGNYLIGAGTDFDNDFIICDEGEACGMYPQLNQPALVTVGNANVVNVDFTTGFGSALGAATADGAAGRGLRRPSVKKIER